jgi:type VI secretion system protein ImpF
MAEAVSRERLQPSLLDRLADEVRGVESEIGRVRRMLLPRLDEARKAALAELLAPERQGVPGEADLAPFVELGAETVGLARQLVGLEQRRQGELRTRFVLSPERLRACVLRDLTALLNTESLRWRAGRAEDPALAERPDIEDYPRVAASVVNYGIPPLAGRTSLEPPAVAADLEQAIRAFEPRLRASTVKVRPVGEAQAGHAIAFDVEAELWGEPVPLRLLLRTLIDLESGAATVRQAGTG